MPERGTKRQWSEARRFCVRFAVLATTGFAVLSAVPDESLEPYLRALAAAASLLLSVPGVAVIRDGTWLGIGGFSVHVEGQCSALYEATLLGAAILASPVSLSWRLIGVVGGGAVLMVVNVVRIASLLVVGALAPEWFGSAHLFVWQALLVVAISASWLAWLAGAREAAPR